jgi:hypothetical protein
LLGRYLPIPAIFEWGMMVVVKVYVLVYWLKKLCIAFKRYNKRAPFKFSNFSLFP